MEEFNDEISQPTTSGKRKAEWFDIDKEHNTYVYVTGLPSFITEDDFIDLMKKYGIIAKKLVPGNPFNTKLYRNKDGSLKGDALCKYVRPESVELALTHLNGYHYDDKHVIQCERAKFEMKGSYDPSKKPRIDPKSKIKQKKTIEKLLSWESSGQPPEAKQKRVILKFLFTPDEIVEDPSLILDIKEDVEAKCAELGFEPKKVEIFDKHPDGVVAATFADVSHAQKCIELLDNRAYAGRFIKAELWDGKTKFRIQETDEESEKRLEKWQKDISGFDDKSTLPNEISATSTRDKNEVENPDGTHATISDSSSKDET